MSTKAKEPSEGDVIVARALSSYAQLRAYIASWSGLSPTAAAENEGADDADEELFTAEPETAGVGYITPQDGERSKISTDKLRKQMLGKRARGGTTGLERVGGSKKIAAPRKGVFGAAKIDEDSEEEEGRSAVGKRRRQSSLATSGDTKETDADPMGTHGTLSHPNDGRVIKKPPSSYLDEILAKRSKKKRRKNKVKHQEQ